MAKLLKFILIPLAILAIAFFAFKTWTKSHSSEAISEMTVGDLNVKVNYCQPAVKGRVIFGELVPYDIVWRTGANEASLISFSRDVLVGGQKLKAGKYSLWTIPTPTNWTILFNKQTGQWGTNYDSSHDVLKVQVPSAQVPELTELFTISMTKGNEEQIVMNLAWEKTQVAVELK